VGSDTIFLKKAAGRYGMREVLFHKVWLSTLVHKFGYGRLFVQFTALILISAIRKEMRSSKLIEKYTVRGLLQEMKTLTKVKYSGKCGHILTEVTKAQRDILKALDIQLPGMA
jgi:hypothetical protein